MDTKEVKILEGKVVDYDGFMYIYYSYKGRSTRISTTVKSEDKKAKLTVILDKKRLVDDILTAYWNEFHEKPSVEYLKDHLDRPVLVKTKEILPMLLQYVELKADIQPQSYKDWNNLIVAVQDYQNDIKNTLYVKDITNKFYENFQIFLSKYRTVAVNGKNIKRGGCNSNTIRKRIALFNCFLKESGVNIPKFK